MTEKEQKAAAKKFAADWQNHGDEKSETHSFWIDLLEHVFGVEDYAKFLYFEKAVKIDGATKYIDVYIASTKVIVEQKSADVKLDKAYPNPISSPTSSSAIRNFAGHSPTGLTGQP